MQSNSVAQSTKQHNERFLTSEYVKLNIQIIFGWLSVIPLGSMIVFWLRFILRYKIKNLSEIRRTYRKLTKGKNSIIICPNHLTMIDSIILFWALGSMSWYLAHYKKLSWNIPAFENFKNTRLRSLVTYLGKCIAVDRQGSKEHHDLVLKKTLYMLTKGEVFTMFIEGGRSRKGRIDTENVRYGVGKLVYDVPNTKILCIYLRGDHQNDYSEIPVKGESFTITFRELYPKTEYAGLRAHRDISNQIMGTLKSMEDEYFTSRQSG